MDSTTADTSGDTSQSFYLLHPDIQRFIWLQRWQELKDIQEMAIEAILARNNDVIISAATASGKTEAAFFPLLTQLLEDAPDKQLVIYISPLKALINDQFARLSMLCESLYIDVYPWHGDVTASHKQRFLRNPRGVLLITPEAMEATLCRKGTQISALFKSTAAIVVDEMHSFVGNERGKQLQSMMWRIEQAAGRRIRRVGLSATLGDMTDAAQFLRSGVQSKEVEVLISAASDSRIAVLVKGYEEPRVLKKPKVIGTAGPKELALDLPVGDEAALSNSDDSDDFREEDAKSPGHIAQYLYDKLRGTNNLIFPNSRHGVEQYTHALNRLCSKNSVRQEFWPHHGSLSKDIRTHTEEELKQRDRSATGVCTNTLEMGIDIGTTKSVAQIGAPLMVSSLRQRAGRSGRRDGEAAVLRCFVIEDELTGDNSLCSKLRTETLQMVAMVHLLLHKWNEPTVSTKLHLSTFVQQALSLVSQYDSIAPGKLFTLLCSAGAPFEAVGRDNFKALLTHMSMVDLVYQDNEGFILLAEKGEKMVGHYSFYATFATGDEYRILADGKTLGTMPINNAVAVGQNILFSGRTWRVMHVDDAGKFISVVRARGGKPPVFTGARGFVHSKVKDTMRQLAKGEIEVQFADATVHRFLAESQDAYKAYGLDDVFVIAQGLSWHMITWLGDSANEALVFMLKSLDIKAWTTDIGVEFDKNEQTADLVAVFEELFKVDTRPELLLKDAFNLATEKWDWALPDHLLKQSYVQARIDLVAATDWLKAKRPEIEKAMLKLRQDLTVSID